MENRFQKWVTVSYVAMAVLVGFLASALSWKLAAVYDLETRIRNIDLVVRGVSLLAGLIVFFVLARHKQATQFMNEVMIELSRVSWPTQKETSSATFIVIVMVIISGIFLGLLDTLWTKLLQMVV